MPSCKPQKERLSALTLLAHDASPFDLEPFYAQPSGNALSKVRKGRELSRYAERLSMCFDMSPAVTGEGLFWEKFQPGLKTIPSEVAHDEELGAAAAKILPLLEHLAATNQERTQVSMEDLDPAVLSFFRQKIRSDHRKAQETGDRSCYPALHDICALWEAADEEERSEEQDVQRHRNLSAALKAEAVVVRF
jgi:hypothetical protein